MFGFGKKYNCKRCKDKGSFFTKYGEMQCTCDIGNKKGLAEFEERYGL